MYGIPTGYVQSKASLALSLASTAMTITLCPSLAVDMAAIIIRKRENALQNGSTLLSPNTTNTINTCCVLHSQRHQQYTGEWAWLVVASGNGCSSLRGDSVLHSAVGSLAAAGVSTGCARKRGHVDF